MLRTIKAVQRFTYLSQIPCLLCRTRLEGVPLDCLHQFLYNTVQQPASCHAVLGTIKAVQLFPIFLTFPVFFVEHVLKAFRLTGKVQVGNMVLFDEAGKVRPRATQHVDEGLHRSRAACAALCEATQQRRCVAVGSSKELFQHTPY